MANHKSAETRIRRNARRTVINTERMSRIRTFVKKIVTAVEAGNAAEAEAAFKAAQPEVMRGVSKGVLHKNTASRKLSRLSAKIKALKNVTK